jgi:UPF0755 protein
LKKFLIFLLLLAVIIGGGALYGWNLYNSVGKHPLDTEEETLLIEVEPNDTLNKVLNKLENEGLLKNLLLTKVYLRYNPVESSLRPGTYEVNAQGSIEEIITELNEGKDLNEIIVTLPEGLTIEKMGEVFENAGMFTKDSFIAAAVSYPVPTWLEAVEGRRYVMEGFLAPNTYKFQKGQTADYVVNYLFKAFVKEMKDIGTELGKELTTDRWNRILTVASMIEREAGNVAEMPMISSVIYNRLAKDMPLQIDATVVYALGLNGTDKVTLDDLKVDSPYNTYKYKNLPLGPIANPGAAAIKAAITPLVSPNIYYVLDPSKGEHFFTPNYNEFLQKKSEFSGN